MTNDMEMYVHCGTQGARDAIEAPAAPSRRRDSHSLACACSPLSPLPRSLPPSLAAHSLAAHSLTLVASLARGSLPHSLAAHCLTRSRLARCLPRSRLTRLRSLPHSLALAASLARCLPRSLDHARCGRWAASAARVAVVGEGPSQKLTNSVSSLADAVAGERRTPDRVADAQRARDQACGLKVRRPWRWANGAPSEGLASSSFARCRKGGMPSGALAPVWWE